MIREPRRLFYHGPPYEIRPGHYLRSERGRARYLVLDARPSGWRQRLEVVRWDPEPIPDGAQVHPLYWMPRRRRAVPFGR